MTTFGALLPNKQPTCTCTEGMCARHDVQTPAEDLYAMVDGLRTKLTAGRVCMWCDGLVDTDHAFCSMLCQKAYLNSTKWNYSEAESYYL